MTGGGPGLTVTVTLLQSGAGLVFQNLSALRLLGDGAGYADYDQGGTVTSRSALVWNGTANGILLHLLGCQDITIENMAVWGAPTLGAANQARTGLLFSSAQGSSPLPIATRLTCRSSTFTRCASKLTPTAGGCVQHGMNPNDVGADTTVYHGCNFSYGTNGLLVASQGAVNHHLHGCSLDTLVNGAWFQQGGNLLWDGCKARAVGSVLKLGTTAVGYASSMGGGGANSSAFLLRNVRTDPAGSANVTVVDSTFAAPGTGVTVEGWDDTASTPASAISFVQFKAQAGSNPSVTLSQAVGAGDTLVAFAAIHGTTLPSQTAISDNQGNVWVYVPNSGIATTSNAAAAAWYCGSAAGTAAGGTTVTFNSGSVSANLVVHEYSGVDASRPIDVVAVASGTNNAPTTATFNTAYANEMLVGYTSQGTATITYTFGSGYTPRANSGSVQAYASEDQFVSAAGAYVANFTMSGTGEPWVCIGLSLKPTGPAVVLGAGSSVHVRDALVSRAILAEEGVGNLPNPTISAALRLENVIVPEGQVAANLCQNLTPNTKVDHIAERTGTYNIVRPDVSTMAGRPRYSPLNWVILQQKPKFFYDLGDIGLLAPNQGWNLYVSPSVPRTDGQYLNGPMQNVQGIVQTDAVGGINTRPTTAGSPTGYVSLNHGSIALGPISGKNWTIIAIVKRNAAKGTGTHPILSNVSGTTGLKLFIDDANGGVVNFTSYSGGTAYPVPGTTAFTHAGDLIYIMVQASPSFPANTTIQIFVQGQQFNTGVVVYNTTSVYQDTSTVPYIGFDPGAAVIADLQIARVATFDLLVPLSAWANIYNYGNSFQGR